MSLKVFQASPTPCYTDKAQAREKSAMKNHLLAVAMLLISFASAQAQAPFKVFSSPKLPPREALERMQLVTAWHNRVTVDGNRDGVFSVQLIPGNAGSQLVVQTYKGGVFLFDADSGDPIWKTHVGMPYGAPQGAAFNSHSILVTRRSMLHVINRFNGAQRAFVYEPALKQLNFGYDLPFTPTATPIADEKSLYVPMGNRVYSFLIPEYDLIEKALARDKARQDALKGGKKDDGKYANPPMRDDGPPLGFDWPQPEYYWGYGLGDQITTTSPLIYGEQVGILTANGVLTSINRYESGKRLEFWEFKTTGRTNAAPGQHQHLGYLASDDFNLYAVDLRSGRLQWRHVSGAAIQEKPEVNDRDVYISPDRLGLRRLDRLNGREVWTSRETTRFLAANDKFVYALDQNGKFFVLDQRRGTTLAKLDLSDWKIAIANEWTDRIYLAANDGQVLCLRHRELTKAMMMKALEAERPREEKKPIEEKKKEEKKDEEKKDDKKDDKDKDKEKAAVKVGRAALLLQAPQVTASVERQSGRRAEVLADERRVQAGP